MSATPKHGQMDPSVQGIHVPYQWSYADATARTGATGFTSADLYKLALQLDNKSLWMLTAITPTWTAVGSGGGGGSGDVVGPGSATNNGIALFDGTTGKLIKSSNPVGTAAYAATGDFDAAGAASGVQSNLTTHANGTGTAVHGLGNASTRNVGTTAGTVAEGDDSRFTNARTPTAHASTHVPGNSDALTTAAAGASAPGDTAIEGTATSFARSDHRHSRESFGTTAGTVCQGNDGRIPSVTEKAALAGTSGTPSVSNKYVTDADSRMTDTRTPTAHAASHKIGGTDEVSDVPLSGFVNRTDSTLSFNAGTRVFTIAPAVSSFVFYSSGTKFTKNTSQTTTLANITAGTLYYIYFDSSGNLQNSTSAWDLTSANVPVATVWCNGTAGRIGEERHSYDRNLQWHKWAHHTLGAQYTSGLGGTFTNTTLSILAGQTNDEDIANVVSGTQTSCLICYQTNPATSMTFDTAASSTLYRLSGNSMQYDNAGTLTTIANGHFGVCWVFATNDTATPIYAIMGQADYSSLANAEASTLPTIPLSTAEWKLLYRVIFKQNAGSPYQVYQSPADDYRSVSSGPSNSGATPSNVLAVNVTTDTTNFANALSASDTTAQAALNTLDTAVATVKKSIVQSSHGFVAGDVVYRSSGTWAKAKADAPATAEALGIVETAVDTNTFIAVFAGQITLSGLTDSAVYFLSAATAGLLTTTEPSTVGQISRPILVASSTTTGVVMQYRPMTIGGMPALNTAYMFVGDDNSRAAAVPMSGDATLAKTGAVTVANSAITAPKIAPSAYTTLQRKNRIMNGAFNIWQRGTPITSGTTADRWKILAIGSSVSVSRQAYTLGQPDVPGEPKYFMQCAVTSSAGAGNLIIIYQPIEDVRNLAGQTCTLSFYASATSSGKYLSTEFVQYFGGGGSSQVDTLGVTKHTLTTTPQKFTVTVTLPSISGKSISGGGDFLGLFIWLDAGAAYNSRTGSLGQGNGNWTANISQVQVEPGSTATDFEYIDQQTELARCQRYFEVYTPTTATQFTGYFPLGSGTFYWPKSWKVSKRKAPDCGGTIAVMGSGVTTGATTSSATVDEFAITVQITSASFYFGFTGYVTGDAEL